MRLDKISFCGAQLNCLAQCLESLAKKNGSGYHLDMRASDRAKGLMKDMQAISRDAATDNEQRDTIGVHSPHFFSRSSLRSVCLGCGTGIGMDAHQPSHGKWSSLHIPSLQHPLQSIPSIAPSHALVLLTYRRISTALQRLTCRSEVPQQASGRKDLDSLTASSVCSPPH